MPGLSTATAVDSQQTTVSFAPKKSAFTPDQELTSLIMEKFQEISQHQDLNRNIVGWHDSFDDTSITYGACKGRFTSHKFVAFKSDDGEHLLFSRLLGEKKVIAHKINPINGNVTRSVASSEAVLRDTLTAQARTALHKLHAEVAVSKVIEQFNSN